MKRVLMTEAKEMGKIWKKKRNREKKETEIRRRIRSRAKKKEVTDENEEEGKIRNILREVRRNRGTM